jgi:oligopeptide transport system substrate-binding protein
MKLLSPYQDFRRATFGALTYYDFNAKRPPFDDRRVRQALSLAIDRRRLSADTLEGATEATDKFLPTRGNSVGESGEAKGESPGFDAKQARRLLAEAGFPGGIDFPRIRLLVNRNEQHRAVAVAIAAMWRQALGIETDILLRNWDEYEAALRGGEYDLVRRSNVMQTIDEQTNMLAMFAPDRLNFETNSKMGANDDDESATPSSRRPESQSEPPGAGQSSVNSSAVASQQIQTEQQALADMPAIPIYFASSYALVKPYVAGFDSNLLDAPSLQHVRMDTNWQPPKFDSEIRVVRNR